MMMPPVWSIDSKIIHFRFNKSILTLTLKLMLLLFTLIFLFSLVFILVHFVIYQIEAGKAKPRDNNDI